VTINFVITTLKFTLVVSDSK